MNFSLILPKRSDTPSVILDKENNQFEFSGRSLPEDASEYYAPILKWVRNYVKHPNPLTELNFMLEYYNSASTRKILEFVLEIEKVRRDNFVVKVNWYFETDDELMKEAGEELSSLSNLNFNYIEVESF